MIEHNNLACEFDKEDPLICRKILNFHSTQCAGRNGIRWSFSTTAWPVCSLVQTGSFGVGLRDDHSSSQILEQGGRRQSFMMLRPDRIGSSGKRDAASSINRVCLQTRVSPWEVFSLSMPKTFSTTSTSCLQSVSYTLRTCSVNRGHGASFPRVMFKQGATRIHHVCPHRSLHQSSLPLSFNHWSNLLYDR